MYQINKRSQKPVTKQIGIYRFNTGKLIGKGFSSTVYKGWAASDKQTQFAIKVIQDKSIKGFRRKLLQNQIRCFSLTIHQNLMRCFDVYSTKNNHYLITQYCQGGNLAQLITKKKLSQIQIVSYLRQLINGMIQLISFRILHRDIKPSNLLISGRTLKIADFGFSCTVQEALNKSKQNVGTPAYMAPQAILENQYSQKSQVFAFGVVGYQIMTGKLPWKAGSEKQLAIAMKRKTPIIKDCVCSQQLLNIIMNCLKGEAKQRPSILQLKDSLDGFLSKSSKQTDF